MFNLLVFCSFFVTHNGRKPLFHHSLSILSRSDAAFVIYEFRTERALLLPPSLPHVGALLYRSQPDGPRLTLIVSISPDSAILKSERFFVPIRRTIYMLISADRTRERWSYSRSEPRS
jgi:hypothetical protein